MIPEPFYKRLRDSQGLVQGYGGGIVHQRPLGQPLAHNMLLNKPLTLNCPLVPSPSPGLQRKSHPGLQRLPSHHLAEPNILSTPPSAPGSMIQRGQGTNQQSQPPSSRGTDLSSVLKQGPHVLKCVPSCMHLCPCAGEAGVGVTTISHQPQMLGSPFLASRVCEQGPESLVTPRIRAPWSSGPHDPIGLPSLTGCFVFGLSGCCVSLCCLPAQITNSRPGAC